MFSMLSCSPINRCEYLCTITYSIDGISHTEEVKLITGDNCTPAYVHGRDMITVTAIPSSYYHEGYIIYQGSLPVRVENFEYKLIRKFKVSSFNGRELKD